MDWIPANWFWILIFGLFIAMRMFGHGGGHRRGGKKTNEGNADETQLRSAANTGAGGGHRH